MRNHGNWAVAVAAGVCLLLAAPGLADAKPAYANAEKKSCSFCHVGKTGDKVFTDAGTFYSRHHTLKGFGKKASPAAEPTPKAAPSPAATAPADPAEAPAAAETARMDKTAAASGTDCPCDCEGCRMKCGKRHGHMHGEGKSHPMMEKMSGHLEEMKKAVAGLRESEKKMESLTDPQAFRAAVLDHLRMLDDLQESHLNHMETMMGPGHGDMPGPADRQGQ